MSAISLRLPNSIHKRLREVAMRDDVSINQFIATAVAEKLSALLTAEYLGQRSRRGRRSRYLKVLRKVHTDPPQRSDE
ncbi:MAG: toxin-antitoxin system HicB family antitoxin [Planctomycetes bacterium]|nr:toxin-antitoxin system HicB family antitoxin [Planctomycetota bacterium]